MSIVDLGINPVLEPPLESMPEPANWFLERVEKGHILSCLDAHGGNRTHAAKALGISVRTLQRKLKKWSIV